jgi:hypothetical protein
MYNALDNPWRSPISQEILEDVEVGTETAINKPKHDVSNDLRYVTSQRSESLVYTAAEAWNHADIHVHDFIPI